jgi:hypothetical protein
LWLVEVVVKAVKTIHIAAPVVAQAVIVLAPHKKLLLELHIPSQ